MVSRTAFRFGDWTVDPASNRLSGTSGDRHLEPLAMQVLVTLCATPGQVVSAEVLLETCWGSNQMGDNPVHKVITQLRGALGDRASAPIYIETIRKRGYRTHAPVLPLASEQVGLGSWQGRSPFRGLQPFTAEHASVFFGRSAALAQLLQAMDQQIASSSSFMLILGPSGSGKTSLVLAGVMPALSRARPGGRLQLCSQTTLEVGEQAGQSLWAQLAAALLDWEIQGQGLFPGASAHDLAQLLEHRSADALSVLQAAMARVADAHSTVRLGLFVDKLEGIFNTSAVAVEERQRFLQMLAQWVDSDLVSVVAACRNDYYPELMAQPELAALKAHQGHFDLNPPSFAEISQMIRLPALAAELRFEVDPRTRIGLDDVLCDIAGPNPDALPLLQYCLQELYRLRSPEGVLSYSAFECFGGLEGAIGQRAEHVVNQLTERQREFLPRILARMVVISAHGEHVSSQRVPWSALQDSDEIALVWALVESRLFVSELVGQERGFGLAHDALLRFWPRVQAWITAHRQSLAVRARVHDASLRWEADDRSPDLLLPRGKPLAEAAELLRAQQLPLLPSEVAYISASRAKVRRANMLSRVALVSLVGLSLLAGILGLLAMQASNTAQARTAQAEGLMSYMLGELADKLRPLDRLDLLQGVSQAAMKYLEQDDSLMSSRTARMQKIKALGVIGEVGQARGATAQAQQALLAANAQLERELQAYPGDTQALAQLGVNHFWLGQIALNAGQPEQVRSHFQHYLETSNQLNRLEPTRPDWWMEQAYGIVNLASLKTHTLAELDEAINDYLRAAELEARAVRAVPGQTEWAVEVSKTLSWLARSEFNRGYVQAAQQTSLGQINLLASVRQGSADKSKWSYYLATAHTQLADFQLAGGQAKSAKHSWALAYELLTHLHQSDPANDDIFDLMVSVQVKQALADRTSGAPSGTVEGLRSLITEVTRRKQLSSPDKRWDQALADMQLALANAQLGQRNFTAAQHAATASIRQYQESAPDVRNEHQLVYLARAWGILSVVYVKTNRLEEWHQACAEMSKVITGKELQTFNYYILEQAVNAYRCLGDSSRQSAVENKLKSIGL